MMATITVYMHGRELVNIPKPTRNCSDNTDNVTVEQRKNYTQAKSILFNGIHIT
jgi:hypothetical protein